MRELDHLQIPLAGRNLIEASAGTGKTYAIALLYLRLVVEEGLTPEQILVVTYTEAATEELRGRIRSRLREALDLFAGGTTDDPCLHQFVANGNGRGPGPEAAMERLTRALTSFDLAAILTIHAFCLRALQENAFESGSLYDTELVTDSTPLFREIADDFWRSRFFTEPAPLLGLALRSGLSPDGCRELLAGLPADPGLRIIPSWDEGAAGVLEAACRETCAAVAAAWRAGRGEILALLTDPQNLSQAEGFYRPDRLAAYAAGMDDYAAGSNPWETPPGFERFTTAGIAAGTKKKGTPPAHPFFDRCGELAAAVAARFNLLRWELIAYARQELPARKRGANIRFFDDLLCDLAAALRSGSGPRLAASLRERYKAALIDEFQDTDPVQYDIFRAISGDTESPLFLIGDPKQAIYSFRGADIFAYLEAAAEVAPERRFTLTTNWRSTPSLLAAFNRIFTGVTRPFVFGEIAYHPLRPGRGGEASPFKAGDPPCQLWVVPEGDGKGLTVGDATGMIAAAVAAEIARLLRGGAAALAGRPLLPEEVAVVVRNHWQAREVQEALRELRIPSVMRSERSIFETDEARELCTLLAALADPGNETRVRTALVTEILGRSGDRIAELLDDEAAWDDLLQRFGDYHHLWREKGFMVMSRALLDGEGIRGRLLRRPDGERRLTNLRHCFEVIHRAAHAGRLGIEGQTAWFGERVSGGETGEEYQIRLETDEKAVRIVTVHLSKGLEYPVVFCPYLWGGTRGGQGVLSFHDGFTPVRDLGSPDYEAHRTLALKESLAEGLRLLYVALTRARYRCYLVGGKFYDRNRRNRPESSPLAYLFHASEAVRGSDDLVGSLEEEVRGLPAGRMAEQLAHLAAAGEGEIAVREMPDTSGVPGRPPAAEEGETLRCRLFRGEIDRSWRVASFTSFARHEAPDPELPDRDASPAAGEVVPPPDAGEEPPGKSIFTFPRGAGAGILLHEIFETLDFAAVSAEHIAAAVAAGLARHSCDPDWGDPLCAMVSNVLAAPLGTDGLPFTLAGLRPGSWLTELEFFFPLRFVTAETLREPLRRWGGTVPPPRSGAPLPRPQLQAGPGGRAGVHGSRVRAGGAVLPPRLEVEPSRREGGGVRPGCPGEGHERESLWPPVPPLHGGPRPLPLPPGGRVRLPEPLRRGALPLPPRDRPVAGRGVRHLSRSPPPGAGPGAGGDPHRNGTGGTP